MSYSDESLNDELYAVKPQTIPPDGGLLKLQTAMGPQAPAAPKAPMVGDGDNLPVVPRAELAQWIQEHQAQEEKAIPSGQPSEADQQHADVSRGIGNATGSLLAGIQNTIGILKPGSANYTQADMAQKQGEQYAQEALGRAPAARQESIQNAQLGAMQDEKRQKQMSMVQALKQQQDAQNPDSEMSKQAQAAFRDKINTELASIQNPELRKRFTELMMTTSHMPASRLDALDKQGYVDKLVALESNERAQGAHNDLAAQNAKGSLGLGYAQLDEKVAHDRAQEEKDKNKEVDVKVNQDRIANAEIKDLNNADDQLRTIYGGVKTGKIDVSAPHAAEQWGVNLVRKVSPGAGDAFNLHIDEALKSMEAITPLIQGLAERSVTKSSRYTPARWTKITALPEDSDELVTVKLKSMHEFIKGLREETEGLLHTDTQGNPVEKIGQNKAVTGGRLDQQARERETKRMAQDDPEKDKALSWAKSHPGDPMSKQILQHYGVQ